MTLLCHGKRTQGIHNSERADTDAREEPTRTGPIARNTIPKRLHIRKIPLGQHLHIRDSNLWCHTLLHHHPLCMNTLREGFSDDYSTMYTVTTLIDTKDKDNEKTHTNQRGLTLPKSSDPPTHSVGHSTRRTVTKVEPLIVRQRLLHKARTLGSTPRSLALPKMRR